MVKSKSISKKISLETKDLDEAKEETLPINKNTLLSVNMIPVKEVSQESDKPKVVNSRFMKELKILKKEFKRPGTAIRKPEIPKPILRQKFMKRNTRNEHQNLTLVNE